MIVGLTTSAERLVQIRQNRILMLQQDERTAYVDPDEVKRELMEARRLFTKMHWPVIDVTRRSIEETAAAILQLYTAFRERQEESEAAERS